MHMLLRLNWSLEVYCHVKHGYIEISDLICTVLLFYNLVPLEAGMTKITMTKPRLKFSKDWDFSLSVCFSVCHHNSKTMRDMNFIFCLHIPQIMLFQMTQRSMTL